MGAQLSENFGGPSVLISTIKTLNKFIPNLEFTFLSPNKKDCKWSEKYGIKVIPYPKTRLLYPTLLVAFLLKKLGLNISSMLKGSTREIWNEYNSADMIVDIWGIMFSDSFDKKFIPCAMIGAHFFLGKLLKKPVVKYTADMGPFNNRWNRFFVNFYLNKIDVIFARGNETKKSLIGIKVVTPIHVYPDTAFLLEKTPNKKIDGLIHQKKSNKKCVVGVSVSCKLEHEERYKDQYTTIMAQTIDYLVKDLNAFVFLIPNEIIPNVYNDSEVAKKIYEKVIKKEEVMILLDEYSAGELKGVISKCDFIIAARYHSIIAAISSCVPTIAISWHHKYHQVLKMVGQEDYLCDIESLNFDLLKQKIKKLCKNRKRIRTKISSKIPSIKESVLEGGKMTRNLLERYKKLA